VAAALIMSVVHASLRIISSEGDVPLPRLAARMNDFLHRCTQATSYATFFYAQIDERSGELRYVNAGHNPPFLVRAIDPAQPDVSLATAEIEQLPAGGTVIGLFPGMEYEEAAVHLKPGDVLLICTDGVTEAMSVDGEEFGEPRLQSLMRELAPLPVQQISSRLVDALRTWTTGAPQHDDLTFVLLKVKEPCATIPAS
jgi:sigma-B regulation protein RsbU (phosphoserine phosphatase)